jgi:hypothetical protein
MVFSMEVLLEQYARGFKGGTAGETKQGSAFRVQAKEETCGSEFPS